jgi:hypothetical protein
MAESLSMSDMIAIVSAIFATDIARYLNADELTILSNLLYCLSGDLAAIASARAYAAIRRKEEKTPPVGDSALFDNRA